MTLLTLLLLVIFTVKRWVCDCLLPAPRFEDCKKYKDLARAMASPLRQGLITFLIVVGLMDTAWTFATQLAVLEAILLLGFDRLEKIFRMRAISRQSPVWDLLWCKVYASRGLLGTLIDIVFTWLLVH